MNETDLDFDTEGAEQDLELDFEDGTEQNDAPEAGEQADATEQADLTKQADVTEQAVEAVDAEAEAKAAAAKEAAEKEAAEKAAALENFKTLVTGTLAHEDRDTATGVLPVAVVQEVVDAYRGLDAKGRRAATEFLSDTMQTLMVEGASRVEAFLEARTIVSLVQATKSVKGQSGVTVTQRKVDPTEAFAERIAAMMLAPSLVTVPEDVDAETWAEKAQALAEGLSDDVRKYQEWQAWTAPEGVDPESDEAKRPAAPEVSPVVVAAAKIAAGRSVGTVAKRGPKGEKASAAPRVSSGHRGDMGQHIREAMDTVAVGDFMSVAEIGKVVTSQYNGEKPPPSSGAIAARLFPQSGNCTLDFVRPEGKEHGHANKGAVRTA